MKNKLATLLKALIVCVLISTTPSVSGVTLDQLRHDAKLTPKRFAAYFSEFQFKFHAEVQAPETFLASESGDCDDFATLAATILGEKGYTTRLISVRMARETHVVCYVEETKSYLDYNNRGCLFRTVSSDGSLNDIARKVAKSFDAKWTSVAEFTFADQTKRVVNMLLAEGPAMPAADQFVSAAAGAIKVDF